MKSMSVWATRSSRLAVLAATFVTAGPGVAKADTFLFTGGEQTYTAPAGINEVHIVAVGAPGGVAAGPNGFPSRGALVSADLPVLGGQTVLYIEVGGPGTGFSTAGPTGGFNGGGSGGISYTAGWAPGGGGASDIRTLPAAQADSLDSRLMVAGGGGGASSDSEPGGGAGQGGDGHGGAPGGAAAGGVGGSGCFGDASNGSDGAVAQGGTGGFGYAFDGMGNPAGPDASGGGGGGGYYGGGGGGASEHPFGFPPFCAAPDSGGGGGGSSFVSPISQNPSIGLSPSGAVPEVVITAPVPTALLPPQLAGAAIVGSTLTETHAAWANAPTTISDQWLSCDATGSLAGCHSIAGATNSTYRLVDADAARTVRVEETASNVYGAGIVAVTPPTAVVQVPEPTAMTGRVTNIGKRTATLHASINPNGEPVAVAFQFSRRPNMSGAKVTRSIKLQPGVSPTRVSIRVSHLAKHTRYYFRAIATDTEHHTTVRGRVLSFRTTQR